jgi:hypothetical protein
MDSDEYTFIKSDYNTYNDDEEVEKCVYCGEEEDLNVVHYGFNPNTSKVYTIAINPMPHDKLHVAEGYIRRIEYVCNNCLE